MDVALESLLWRFGAVALLASLYGLQRQRTGKPIGFGTFTFVAIGSCGLSVTALELARDNPLPLLGAVVTGIGFLGAGALIRQGERIGGFTSAATIWIMAVFGLVVGVGEYAVGAIVYGVIWGVGVFDRFLENRALGSYQRKLTLIIADLRDVDEVRGAIFEDSPPTELSVGVDRSAGTQTMVFSVAGSREELDRLMQRLKDLDWLRSFQLE